MAVAAWPGLGRREKRRIAIVLTIAAVAASFGMGVLGVQAVKSREVYERALSAARRSPELREAIGSPIEDSFYPGFYRWEGSSSDTPSQEVRATLYVSGPKGSATIHAYAQKFEGEWSYYHPLAIMDGSGRRIHLEEVKASQKASSTGYALAQGVTVAMRPVNGRALTGGGRRGDDG